jgi:hypothetical protein
MLTPISPGSARQSLVHLHSGLRVVLVWQDGTPIRKFSVNAGLLLIFTRPHETGLLHFMDEFSSTIADSQ